VGVPALRNDPCLVGVEVLVQEARDAADVRPTAAAIRESIERDTGVTGNDSLLSDAETSAPPHFVTYSGADANRPGDATNAPGHDTGEVTPMRDQRTQIVAQFESVIATAMDDGMTESEIAAKVKEMAAAESERRTQETARELYGQGNS
jgi:DNA-binding PucR family transcriptional regulator